MASIGYDAELSLGGTTVGKAQEVSPDLTADKAETTVREDNGWENSKQGLKRLECSIDALWVPTDEALAAIEDAFFNDSDLEFQIQDENDYGWQGTCGVYGLSRGEALGDALTVSIDITSRGQVTQMPTGS